MVVGHKQLLFYLLIELRVVSKQLYPVFFYDGVALHFGMSSNHESISLLETYLESADYGAGPKLPPVYFLFVHFVSNIVLSVLDEQYFQALIKFLLNNFMGFVWSKLKTVQKACDKRSKLIVLECVKRVLNAGFKLVDLPLRI